MQKRGIKKVSILDTELSSDLKVDLALMDDIKALIIKQKFSKSDAIKFKIIVYLKFASSGFFHTLRNQ
jgi:hypothetical protein